MNEMNNTSNVRVYTPPHITIVEFKVENCFVSGETGASTQSLLGHLFSSRDESTCYYTGNETYSEYTDNSGGFSTAAW